MSTTAVIPAQPGFFVLELYEVGSVAEVAREPVVAWAVKLDGGPLAAEPIVHDCGFIGEPEDGSPVLYPDGHVVMAEIDRRYNSIEDWFADLPDLLRRQRIRHDIRAAAAAKRKERTAAARR